MIKLWISSIMHIAEAEKKEIAERPRSCHRERKYGPRGKGIMMDCRYVLFLKLKFLLFFRRCGVSRNRLILQTVQQATGFQSGLAQCKPQTCAVFLKKKNSLKFATSETHVGNLGDNKYAKHSTNTS
jgi:hypothetical protein